MAELHGSSTGNDEGTVDRSASDSTDPTANAGAQQADLVPTPAALPVAPEAAAPAIALAPVDAKPVPVSGRRPKPKHDGDDDADKLAATDDGNATADDQPTDTPQPSGSQDDD